MKNLKNFSNVESEITERFVAKGNPTPIIILSFSVIIGIIIIGVLTFMPKQVDSQIIVDSAKVEFVEHVPLRMNTTYINTGKSLSPIVNTIPEKNIVKFKYKEKTITVDNSEIYKLTKDKVGENVSCELKIINFDDGTQEVQIVKVIN